MNREIPKQKILIVDDDPGNLKLLAEILMPEYEVSVSTNGREGIEIATSEDPPDLILLDIMMPGIDGYDVCKVLKESGKTENIPVIFITGKTEAAEETKGFRLGAIDYISKPCSPAVVKARIGTHLALKLYRDHLEEMVLVRTNELRQNNEQLQREIADRKKAQEDLRKSHAELERRVEERTAELRRSNSLLKQEIEERKRSEQALKEKEEYLRTIMATIQTGLIIIDPETRTIVDANPFASQMIGCAEEEIIGRPCVDAFGDDRASGRLTPDFCLSAGGNDCILETAAKGAIHARRSAARARIRDKDFIIQSFLDITDMKILLEKQEINIDLAKKLLGLVNGAPPRYIDLSADAALFVDAVSVPCYAEGGDHYFVRSLATGSGGPSRTLISLKDQSGHEVNSVLKSIITDLIHNALLTIHRDMPLDACIAGLNDEICDSDIFSGEDFFTSMNAEIDHQFLSLTYLSAGHPPFLVIRGTDVRALPEPGATGGNLPVAIQRGVPFTSGTLRLRKGDRLILYTDGLTEMPVRNLEKTLTRDELVEIVREIVAADPALPVNDVMQGLLARICEISLETVIPAVKNTSGDDVTLIGVEIEDREAYAETAVQPENRDDVSRIIETLYAALAAEWTARGFEAADLRLRSVLEEALLNAWIHGNKEDKRKKITVRWRFGNDFHFEVIDEGAGFDYGKLPDPTRENNIEKPFGRGVFIIRHLAAGVRWKDKGRHIVVFLKKRVDAENDRQAGRMKKLMKIWENVGRPI